MQIISIVLNTNRDFNETKAVYNKSLFNNNNFIAAIITITPRIK